MTRLAEPGIVDTEQVGQTRRYRLNVDHVAAPAVIVLASVKTELLQRIGRHVGAWRLEPV